MDPHIPFISLPLAFVSQSLSYYSVAFLLGSLYPWIQIIKILCFYNAVTLFCVCFAWINQFLDAISLDFLFSKVFTLSHFFFAWILESLDPIDYCFVKFFTPSCLCFSWNLKSLYPICLDFHFSKVITLIGFCFSWILGCLDPISLEFCYTKVFILSCL